MGYVDIEPNIMHYVFRDTYFGVSERVSSLHYSELTSSIIDFSEAIEAGIAKGEDNPFTLIGFKMEYSEPAEDYPSYERRKHIAHEIAEKEGVLIEDILEGAPTQPPLPELNREYKIALICKNPDYDFPNKMSNLDEEPGEDSFEVYDKSTIDISRKLSRER